MSSGIKIALPGYDAERDTNLDHFALWSMNDDSVDNILIKEKKRDSVNIAGSGGIYTYNHALGYVPFFMVYAYNGSSYEWINGFNIYSQFRAYATTQDLILINNSGSTRNFKFYVFYDNMAGTSANTITESPYVVKVARKNKSILSKDPNDFVFHSDLNTFKIITKNTTSLTLNTTGSETAHSVAHGKTYIPFVIPFVMFNDGRICMPGAKGSGATAPFFTRFTVDATNMNFYYVNTTASYTMKWRYYICEVPL